MMCAVEFEINENVIYARELCCMCSTRHACTSSLLAQGHRSWLRFY